MKKLLFHLRYWFEIIALPVFIIMVIHLAGHGSMLLLEPHHEHGHGHGESGHGILESILTPETLIGGLLMLVFVWLWHRPTLKKWVPCSHDHCHTELPLPHILAIIALCLHFFPEAAIRHELLEGALAGEAFNMVAMLGFLAHLGVDIIVAIVISSYWQTKTKFWASLGTITGVWVIAFLAAESFSHHLSALTEGGLAVVSAFLLSMFIHRPHRAKKCEECE